MKLTDKEVAALSRGALYTETDGEGYLVFHRFTKKIEDFYGTFNPNFAMKAAATSGVCLHFTTDAAALSFEYASKAASSRKFDYFDITVDGALVAHPGKEDGAGETGKVSLSLGAGAHTVCVYFPALAALRVRCFTLDSATYCTPVKRARKLYCLGDSITQGYDAWYPMQSYATLLSDKLDAEILNHGIGGEVFQLPPKYALFFPCQFVTGGNRCLGRKTSITGSAARSFAPICSTPTCPLIPISSRWPTAPTTGAT